MADLLTRLYERHCQGDDLCGEAQRAIETLKKDAKQKNYAPPALECNADGIMEDKSQDADWLRARFFEMSAEIERLESVVTSIETERDLLRVAWREQMEKDNE